MEVMNKYKTNRNSAILKMLFYAECIAAALGAMFSYLYFEQFSEIYLYRIKWWKIGEDENSISKMGDFECIDINDSDDCILEYSMVSDSFIGSSFAVWCIDEGDIVRVLFEKTYDNLPFPGERRWDDLSCRWRYGFRIPGGQTKKIVVSDGESDVTVRYYHVKPKL